MRKFFFLATFSLLAFVATTAAAQLPAGYEIVKRDPNALIHWVEADTLERQANFALFYHYVEKDTVTRRKNETETVLRLGEKWSQFTSAQNFCIDTFLSKYGKATTVGMEEKIFAQFQGRFTPKVLRDDKGVFYTYEAFAMSRYYFRDSTSVYNWTIGAESDTLRVMGRLTHKATIRLNGVDWEAWYCPELPFDAGPWKLCGLPGTILKARTADGVYEFTATKLEPLRGRKGNGGEEFVIKCPIAIGKKYKELSREDFLKEREEYYTDIRGYKLKKGVIWLGPGSEPYVPKKRFYRPLEL